MNNQPTNPVPAGASADQLCQAHKELAQSLAANATGQAEALIKDIDRAQQAIEKYTPKRCVDKPI